MAKSLTTKDNELRCLRCNAKLTSGAYTRHRLGENRLAMIPCQACGHVELMVGTAAAAWDISLEFNSADDD